MTYFFMLGRRLDFLFHFTVHVLKAKLLDYALQSTDDFLMSPSVFIKAGFMALYILQAVVPPGRHFVL